MNITRNVPVVVGTQITLRSDPKNPGKAIYEMSPRSVGWALIGVGALIGGITTGIAYAAHKSKGFAALSGAVSAAEMIIR